MAQNSFSYNTTRLLNARDSFVKNTSMNLLIFLFAITTASLAQPDYNGVTAAIQRGDVQTLSTYFASQVELDFGQGEKMYAKTAATQQVQGFFTKNRPTSCSLVHKGAARGNTNHYCISQLSAGSQKYRVYIYFKSEQSRFMIQKMRFAQE